MMTMGAPGTAVWTVSVPGRVPVVVGLKVMVMVQVAREARVVPQLLAAA
jgi:hypothetical protein